MDFVSDALATGRALRIFTVIDSYTRESLAIEVNTGISSRQVTRVLERVIEERGKPGSIRCDNGPEFTSLYFMEWCKENSITLVHIQPGKPVQNGHVESFKWTIQRRVSEPELLDEFGRRETEKSKRGARNTTRSVRTAVCRSTPEEFAKIYSELTSGMAATPSDRPSA